jgi:hypothetical protein
MAAVLGGGGGAWWLAIMASRFLFASAFCLVASILLSVSSAPVIGLCCLYIGRQGFGRWDFRARLLLACGGGRW